MKKNVLLTLLILYSGFLLSQVGIDTSSPHQKSVLEIVSKNNNMGVLFPRLTTIQINAINPTVGDNVVDGLWVYNIDTKCYNYWAAAPKNQWLELCGIPIGVIPVGAATINCAGATTTGTLTAGTAASGVSVSVPYTAGNGGPYTTQSITSTGVTGLTATLPGGNFANGAGSLNFTISGTPNTSGTASFALNMGGTTCTFTVTVAASFALNCSGAATTGSVISGTAVSGVAASVPYTGGNGSAYTGQTIASTGVIGLTATLPGGNFANGAGNLNFTISGTPNTSGTASFPLTIGGQSCTFTVMVTAPANAVYACTSVSVGGNYTVATALTSANTITVTLNVTQAGNIRLLSEDKNGMLFDSGVVSLTAGAGKSVVLNSVTATTGIYPMTSEEVSQGANGADNQTSNYTITNTLTGNALSCSANLDVKPLIYQANMSTTWGTTTSSNGANSGIIQLHVTTRYPSASFFNAMVRNLTSSSLNYSFRSTASHDPGTYTYSGSVSANGSFGSVDAYANSTGAPTANPGGAGAFAGSNEAVVAQYGEVDNIGMNIRYSGQWYKYRLIYDSYRTASSTSPKASYIILYGIYNATPEVYSPPVQASWPYNMNNNNPQDYWP